MNQWAIKDFKNLGGLSSVTSGAPDDIFLVCASFEPRSSVARQYLAKSYRAKRGIIYVNKEFLNSSQNDTRKNLKRLKSILRPRCDELVVAEGSWLDATQQLASLKKVLLTKELRADKATSITIDVTTFNREALIVAIALLRSHLNSSTIRTVYVSPEDMGDWLSSGFRDIRNVIGFSGIQNPSRPTSLVILSGFEPERTSKIIEIHEPSKVFLGIGNPPTEEKFLPRNVLEQQKSALARQDKLTLSRQKTLRFDFPANDIGACHIALEGLVSELVKESNVVLAPMSSKLSTLSAYLVAEHHPEVQITYCLPGQYNTKDYSKGAGHIFISQLPDRTSPILIEANSSN